MVEGGTIWLPPPCPFEPLSYLINSLTKECFPTENVNLRPALNHSENEDKDEQYEDEAILHFNHLLSKLKPTQQSIGETMVYVIQRPHLAVHFVKAISDEAKKSSLESCFTLLLLISDVVNNAVRGSNWPIQKGLQDDMPNMISTICELIAQRDTVQQKLSKSRLSKLILIWKNQAIFQQKQISGWLSIVNLNSEDSFSFNISNENYIGSKELQPQFTQIFRSSLASLA